MAKSTKALTVKAESNEKTMTTAQVGSTMTVREVAEALGVSLDTVKNCIRRIMPSKMKHGKTTVLSEQDIARISKELKSNTQVTNQLTHEAGSRVANSTTELEVISNALSAFKALQDLYTHKEDEYKATIEKQVDRIQELEHQVEFNEVIDCKRWTDVKKEYHLTRLTKAKVKSSLAEREFWFEKCMGMDKFPTLLIKPEAIDLLVKLNKEANNG